MSTPNNFMAAKVYNMVSAVFSDIVLHIAEFARQISNLARDKTFLVRLLIMLFVLIPVVLIGTAIEILLSVMHHITRLLVMPIFFIQMKIYKQGNKLRKYLFKVMPEQPFEQGIMIREPRSLWHKFLAKLCILAGADQSEAYACCNLSGELIPEKSYIHILSRKSRIILWHELGHCVEPNARPTMIINVFDHYFKGKRYEKKADLYAFRRAFQELPREEAIKEMNLFIKYMHQNATDPGAILSNDCRWRASLAERYIRRYYQQ
jgi:hypothetical protein